MTTIDHNLRKFARVVEALEPWLDRLLFIGGWAHTKKSTSLCSVASPLATEPNTRTL